MHASAVLVGHRAVLIRGPSGSGKSTLAHKLLLAPIRGAPTWRRLVGDDRVILRARHGRVIVACPWVVRGVIEVRGIGLRRVCHEAQAIVGLVVDLGAPDAARLPAEEVGWVSIADVRLPRIAVGPNADPFAVVSARLASTPVGEAEIAGRAGCGGA